MANENERAKDRICISSLLLVRVGGRDIDVVVVGGFTLTEHKPMCVPIQDPNTI